MLRIRSVVALDGLRLQLGLTDGTERIVDVAGLLKGPIFDAIRSDHRMFASVAVDPVLGTVVWPNGADLDPDVLLLGRVPAAIETAARR